MKTAQEPGSIQVSCMMSLRFTQICSFGCRGTLQNFREDCSNVGLNCVTITWQHICKGSLQLTVVGILPHVTDGNRHLGR